MLERTALCWSGDEYGFSGVRLCKCNCGGFVSAGRIYIHGHNRRGCFLTDEAKRKMGESKKGNQYGLGYKHTDEAKERIRLALIGNKRGLGKGASRIGVKHTEEHKRKIGLAHIGIRTTLGYKFTKEQSANLSRARLKQWSNPLYRDAQVRAMVRAAHIMPNRAEMKLSYILRHTVPKTFYYNGDFRLGISVGGKIPDFVNMNSRKQVIELFGDYWHRGQNPENLIKYYAQYHYDCLVIWEHELADKKSVVGNILAFVENKNGKNHIDSSNTQ